MASKGKNTSAPANDEITLKSSDGREFVISKSVAALSAAITKKLSTAKPPNANEIPLPDVDGDTLHHVVTYLNALDAAGDDEEKKKQVDHDFLPGKPEIGVLLDVAVAANSLEISDLKDLVSELIADTMENKSVEWVRKAFGLENNLTAAEEAEMKAQYPWAFEGVEPDDED